MWFFMYACYLLMGLSFLLLTTLGVQGYFGFHVMGVNHPTFALLTAIIYLFAETLVIFFFVGTGVSVKEYTRDHNVDATYHRRSIDIKRRLYPPVLTNILLFMIVFITGGAVDTQLMPGFVHGLLYLATVLHFLKVIKVQHQCFRDNTAIILKMSGIESNIELSVSKG